MVKILHKEIEQVAGPEAYKIGKQLTLWRLGQHSIECMIEEVLGKGATAIVYRVNYAGLTRALKVFNSAEDFVPLGAEASLMLKLNHPTSHPNVLAIDFIKKEEESKRNKKN